MIFGGITEKLRQKLIKNIDTVIGFAIKIVNKKIHFNSININQIIGLL